jgi:hypothetical protein
MTTKKDYREFQDSSCSIYNSQRFPALRSRTDILFITAGGIKLINVLHSQSACSPFESKRIVARVESSGGSTASIMPFIFVIPLFLARTYIPWRNNLNNVAMIGIPMIMGNSPVSGADSIIQKTKNIAVMPISHTRKSTLNARCKVVIMVIVELEFTVPFKIHDAP